MTTKVLDHTICTFKMLLSWRFPHKKTAFLDICPLCPQWHHAQPPHKRKFYFIVILPSLKYGGLMVANFAVDFPRKWA